MGHRFHGSTKTGNRKAAEAVERELRAKGTADLEAQKRSGNGPLTLDIAAARYWVEVGQYHAGAATTKRDLARLIGRVGKNKRLDEITDRDVADLVAWRRQHTVKGRAKTKDGKQAQMIAPATVNRSTTEVLKKLFTRAKKGWRYQFPLEPNWREHRLHEPEERVRELHDEEGRALDATVRPDYAPWLEFASLTGLRHQETLIRWPNVNWAAKVITTIGKGGRTVTAPITAAVAAILNECKGHHPEYVFTYVCRRTRKHLGLVKGQRYPLTKEGTKTEWRRTVTRSGVKDFRFHDLRHTVATKVLRETGNLKIVKQTLNHRDIKTTTRYAHVLDSEVADALQRVADSRRPKAPENAPDHLNKTTSTN
jgi:integrase